jgi:hypothetical protein
MAQTSASTRKIADLLEVSSCCWHESGHVLYGLLKHFHIKSVFVNYTEAVEGVTNYFWIDHLHLDIDLIEHIAIDEVGISYSGFLAEALFYRNICGSTTLPKVLKQGSSLDIKAASDTIKEHALALPGKPRQQLKRRVQKETNALLIEYWDDLKLISHRLFKLKRLSFDDLKKLLIKKSINKDFWKQQFREIEALFDCDSPIDSTALRRILTSD